MAMCATSQSNFLGISTFGGILLQSPATCIPFLRLTRNVDTHRNDCEGMRFKSMKKENVKGVFLMKPFTLGQVVVSIGGNTVPLESYRTSGFLDISLLKFRCFLENDKTTLCRQRFSYACSPRCQLADSSLPSVGANGNKARRDIKVAQKVRAFFFYATTLIAAVPLFIIMLIQHPFVMLFDKYRRKMHHFVTKIWAKLTTYFFYKIKIEGWENLPASDEPAVYVANHQSFLDIYSLYQLGRPFKFISKTSNFMIPIIGWAMYLTGHIPLRRLDKKSQVECLRLCLHLLKQGVPVFFFPEGTRSTDGKLAAFKRGAFVVASKGNVPVVPITLIGTGKLMPNKMEGTLSPGDVKLIIHVPIQGIDADVLCNQARAAIAGSLEASCS